MLFNNPSRARTQSKWDRKYLPSFLVRVGESIRGVLFLFRSAGATTTTIAWQQRQQLRGDQKVERVVGATTNNTFDLFTVEFIWWEKPRHIIAKCCCRYYYNMTTWLQHLLAVPAKDQCCCHGK
jgi:hypothetical protein